VNVSKQICIAKLQKGLEYRDPENKHGFGWEQD